MQSRRFHTYRQQRENGRARKRTKQGTRLVNRILKIAIRFSKAAMLNPLTGIKRGGCRVRWMKACDIIFLLLRNCSSSSGEACFSICINRWIVKRDSHPSVGAKWNLFFPRAATYRLALSSLVNSSWKIALRNSRDPSTAFVASRDFHGTLVGPWQNQRRICFTRWRAWCIAMHILQWKMRVDDTRWIVQIYSFVSFVLQAVWGCVDVCVSWCITLLAYDDLVKGVIAFYRQRGSWF